MDLNMPILSVKLKMPQPRKNYIVRQNLFNYLSKLNEYKVTVVKSGAGSGKTTLLSSFIKETKLNNIKWISLDRNSNQTFVFWNYIIETVKEYFKDSQMDFQTLFNSNMQKDNLWQILLLLADKLNIDDDIILVLDDFHMISET
ncbi:MAG: LuxR family transcriptional regulator, partial [Bacillota bacterium]|nr:LuxR family transcriptional regulator [Bacillota bacterium]